jgi:hypothetical protein
MLFSDALLAFFIPLSAFLGLLPLLFSPSPAFLCPSSVGFSLLLQSNAIDFTGSLSQEIVSRNWTLLKILNRQMSGIERLRGFQRVRYDCWIACGDVGCA